MTTPCRPARYLGLDGMVDAHFVAHAEDGERGRGADRQQQPSPRVDRLGERREVIVELAVRDRIEQRAVAGEIVSGVMPSVALAHASRACSCRRSEPDGRALGAEGHAPRIPVQAATANPSLPTVSLSACMTAKGSS
jgi:hypothetical protein